MKQRMRIVLSILLVGLLLGGCSFSRSSKHSSKSSSSPCRSSSAKSTESVAVTSSSYQEEVSSLAILYVGSFGSARDFNRELGQIAKSHGIADWKSNQKTYQAVGIGLKRAKVSRDDLPSLDFLNTLIGSPYYQEIIDQVQ